MSPYLETKRLSENYYVCVYKDVWPLERFCLPYKRLLTLLKYTALFTGRCCVKNSYSWKEIVLDDAKKNGLYFLNISLKNAKKKMCESLKKPKSPDTCRHRWLIRGRGFKFLRCLSWKMNCRSSFTKTISHIFQSAFKMKNSWKTSLN